MCLLLAPASKGKRLLFFSFFCRCSHWQYYRNKQGTLKQSIIFRCLCSLLRWKWKNPSKASSVYLFHVYEPNNLWRANYKEAAKKVFFSSKFFFPPQCRLKGTQKRIFDEKILDPKIIFLAENENFFF